LKSGPGVAGKNCEREGQADKLKDIEAAIRERDQRDRTRAVSPLCAASDAVVLDTTHDSRTRVKRLLLDWVRRKTARAR
jgi:cytidylate kinase